LEGDKAVVNTLFEKISKDKRHRKATKIILEPIEERSFADWTIGYPKLTSKELAKIPGLNDFYSHGNTYLELGEGRAKALLAAFKEGRWRTSIY
jgi:Sensors of blue-light using FAD